MWVIREKSKTNPRYSEIVEIWVDKNYKSLCYYKPKLDLIDTLEGHTNTVYCLTIYKNKLFSGSSDKTIRVWDADTHAHVATLQGHTDGVRCLTIYNKNKLFSCSDDRTIRVWDLDE